MKAADLNPVGLDSPMLVELSEAVKVAPAARLKKAITMEVASPAVEEANPAVAVVKPVAVVKLAVEVNPAVAVKLAVVVSPAVVSPVAVVNPATEVNLAAAVNPAAAVKAKAKVKAARVKVVARATTAMAMAVKAAARAAVITPTMTKVATGPVVAAEKNADKHGLPNEKRPPVWVAVSISCLSALPGQPS
ncbi:hypothetical protein [Ruegeria sp. HKCCD7559]|uniref:hypothetical protein n=1 Tax=Ruegeria sp. HKCCD7559 TaxID=2683005 RepID=UPI001491F5CC|nr:hypothetical protein [Ruegeria sp. HKCCD7559]NOC44420.1 hypothetical protein [Ruegeria sp. HKCCD7559]